MISEFFQKRFGLTKNGSDNLIKGILYTALLDISFMFPVGLYALLIYMWVEPLTGGEIVEPNLGMFIVLILIVLGIIFAFAWKQYHFVFNTTYVESENRRINLGENLRKLPLSFFKNMCYNSCKCNNQRTRIIASKRKSTARWRRINPATPSQPWRSSLALCASPRWW